MGNKNPREKAAFWAGLFLLSFVLLLVAGEAAARLKLYLQTRNAFFLLAPFKKSLVKKVNYRLEINEFNPAKGTYYFKMKPGRFLPPEPYHYGYFTVNSLGFRGKEFNPHNKHNRTRIFCIGESSTFCMESPDADTWPARLGYYLEMGARERFEVINAGFPAAASTTYKNLLRLELVKYSPDILIIYAGANDMILDRNIVKKKANKFWEAIHDKLYYTSILYTLLIEKISYLTQGSAAPAILYSSNPEQTFAENIEQVMRTCREHSVRLIFVRQLYYSSMDLFLRDNASLEEIKHSLKNTRQEGWVTADKIHTFYAIMRRLKELCAQYDIELLDFRQDFYGALKDNKGELFYDYIHLTPEGNDLLAGLVSRRLLRSLGN